MNFSSSSVVIPDNQSTTKIAIHMESFKEAIEFRIGILTNLKNKSDELEKELVGLRSKKDDINSQLVSDLQHPRKKAKRQVQLWLKNVEEITSKKQNIEDQINQMCTYESINEVIEEMMKEVEERQSQRGSSEIDGTSNSGLTVLEGGGKHTVFGVGGIGRNENHINGDVNKLLLLLFFVSGLLKIHGATDYVVCLNSKSPCRFRKIQCPPLCPSKSSSKSPSKSSKAKVCYVNCNSPICKAECKNRKAKCDGPGSACFDPRFIGGDGIVFYFHGKKNQHFSMVSDRNLQINGRFIGLRPAGRARDFTWIQALGLLFHSHSFSIEATPSAKWDDEIDHLKFTFNGEEINIPEGDLSSWKSPQDNLLIERTSEKNSIAVTLPGIAEISVNVVPVTEEDDRIHSYQIPSDNCFAHLEVQFRFYDLSSKVEGVLGRTYRPDFQNPAKPGVAMPVAGGENEYRTTSLLSADCKTCIFSSETKEQNDSWENINGFRDCIEAASSGNGIVCRK